MSVSIINREAKRIHAVDSDNVKISSKRVLHFQDETFKNINEELELGFLYTLFWNSSDPIIVWDLEGRIIAWNKSAEKLYAYSTERIIGKNIRIIVPPDKHQEILDIVERIKSNLEILSFETKRATKDGHVLDILLTATGLVDGKGNPVAIVTTERDVTEKKRLEAVATFAARFTFLGQLSSSVAHEIRNPLGVITNSVYFLNTKLIDYPDDKVRRHLKIIDENVIYANNIIGDLLEVGRNKTNDLQIANLNIILESAIAKITFPENIKIIKKLEKTPMLTLDSEHIQRVFVNIIENAVQSMPEGGELIVGLSRFKDSIEISFKDSGVGITEENMKKLFTPLFTTKPKGLGLGLVISKQIVEGHKGEIVVTSKEGEGTIFTVRLPIRLEEVLVKDVQLDINVLNLGK